MSAFPESSCVDEVCALFLHVSPNQPARRAVVKDILRTLLSELELNDAIIADGNLKKRSRTTSRFFKMLREIRRLANDSREVQEILRTAGTKKAMANPDLVQRIADVKNGNSVIVDRIVDPDQWVAFINRYPDEFKVTLDQILDGEQYHNTYGIRPHTDPQSIVWWQSFHLWHSVTKSPPPISSGGALFSLVDTLNRFAGLPPMESGDGLKDAAMRYRSCADEVVFDEIFDDDDE